MIDGTLYNRFVALIKSTPSAEEIQAFTARLSFSELDFVNKVIGSLRPALSDLLIEKITEENVSHQTNMNQLLMAVQQATAHIKTERRRHSRGGTKLKAQARKDERREIIETFCKKYPRATPSALWVFWDDQEQKPIKVGRSSFLKDVKTFKRDSIN